MNHRYYVKLTLISKGNLMKIYFYIVLQKYVKKKSIKWWKQWDSNLGKSFL